MHTNILVLISCDNRIKYSSKNTIGSIPSCLYCVSRKINFAYQSNQYCIWQHVYFKYKKNIIIDILSNCFWAHTSINTIIILIYLHTAQCKERSEGMDCWAIVVNTNVNINVYQNLLEIIMMGTFMKAGNITVINIHYTIN